MPEDISLFACKLYVYSQKSLLLPYNTENRLNRMETKEQTVKNTHHGHAVKRFRRTLGIKQEALAADMGISQALVSFYET